MCDPAVETLDSHEEIDEASKSTKERYNQPVQTTSFSSRGDE